MTSQPGHQTIAIQILPNISRSKDNQTMKFGQLMEYNMRNIFLEKSHTKKGGKTIARPISKNLKIERNPGSIVQSFCILFLLYAKLKTRNILKLSCRPLAFTSRKAFLQSKKRSGTSLTASFSARFLKK